MDIYGKLFSHYFQENLIWRKFSGVPYTTFYDTIWYLDNEILEIVYALFLDLTTVLLSIFGWNILPKSSSKLLYLLNNDFKFHYIKIDI